MYLSTKLYLLSIPITLCSMVVFYYPIDPWIPLNLGSICFSLGQLSQYLEN